ncbi:MAG TPA: PQQ-dependent sugar dehydrogenase, partial [Rubrobacter sp.]|nr:PQQ-dependent sugar dehydrogenase [Rubrobacter sp.]
MKFALFLAVAFVFAVVACGDDDDAPPAAITPEATQESPDQEPGAGSATEAPSQGSGTNAEPPAVQLVPAFLVNRFSNRVLDLDPIPGEAGRYLALFQDGIIVLLDESAPEDGVLVVDLQDRVNDEGLEEGLLGLAFDPNWEGEGSVYVYYTAADPRRGVLSRLTFDGQSISPESEQVLFEVDQPFPNHNGGALVFGPDGYLYLGLGDGGGRGDPTGNGQNGNHLGSILRFDVSGEEIAVPEDNPFADGSQGFAPETYAYGFRNPWRFSFDRETDTFWVADVGERAFEEIDIVEAGANYGWSIMEGPECFQPPEGC